MIAPIVAQLRKGLVLDLAAAAGRLADDFFSTYNLGVGYWFWYGYHIPSIRRRDAFYAKLERERVAALQ
ncbi:hypothetical protein BDZ91DRAFT_671843 [Kalaharituber pfeilii]|nr:hypothetical protein BDZ91DRAFT_671843 [Kalaharituber pfeilii]